MTTRPSPTDEFVRHALEMMGAWGTVRARRMFGGHGLYRDDVFFALIADDTLYLKVDDRTRAWFEAAGSAPFVYAGKRLTDASPGPPPARAGRARREGGNAREAITLSYWRAPDECLESPATMRDWCALAYAAALRARAAKPVKRSAGTGAGNQAGGTGRGKLKARRSR